MKYLDEIKIGVFAITGLILLVIGWAFLREVSLQKQNTFTVVFDDVAGLTKGSFVRINGLRVGRIDSLTLDTKKNKVLVHSRIQIPKVTIPVDSRLFIRTSGYVGDKYLDIFLGMSSNLIKDGDVIAGEPVIDAFASLEKVSQILNQLNPELVGKNIQDATVGAVGLIQKVDTVADSANKVISGLPKGQDLDRLVDNAHSTVNELNLAIDKASTFAQNESAQGNLSRLLTQANDVSKDLKETLKNANNLANNKAAFEDVNNLLVRAGKIIEQLDELRSDPLIQNDLKETLDNANLAAKRVAFTSDEVTKALNQRFILPRLLFGRLLPKKQMADEPQMIN